MISLAGMKKIVRILLFVLARITDGTVADSYIKQVFFKRIFFLNRFKTININVWFLPYPIKTLACQCLFSFFQDYSTYIVQIFSLIYFYFLLANQIQGW